MCDFEKEKQCDRQEQHRPPSHNKGSQLAGFGVDRNRPIHSLRSCEQDKKKCRGAAGPNVALDITNMVERKEMVADAGDDASENNERAIYNSGHYSDVSIGEESQKGPDAPLGF